MRSRSRKEARTWSSPSAKEKGITPAWESGLRPGPSRGPSPFGRTTSRLRGTAEFIRSNIFGTASQVSLVSQFSLVEKRAVVSWEQPYFFGVPMQTSMNAWLEGEDRKSFGFDRRGVSLNVIKPLAGGFVLLGTLSLSRTKLTYLEIAESEVDRQLQPYSTTLVSGSVIWDRRDDTFNPTRGIFLSFVGEWAYPVFKTESDYSQGLFQVPALQPGPDPAELQHDRPARAGPREDARSGKVLRREGATPSGERRSMSSVPRIPRRECPSAEKRCSWSTWK